jgi:outer membrane protein insertion porin family
VSGEFLLYFTRRFRWSLYALLGSLAVCAVVRAEDSPVVSTSAALGSLPVAAVASDSSTTPSAEQPAASPAEAEQESKRLSKLARILKIRTEGQQNIRERVILAQVKTKKNDLYDPDKLRKDVQAIYGMGNFEDVSLETTDVPGGVIITFKVVEKPMIKRIDFKGNKKVGSSKLRDGISLKENDPLDKFKLNLDVEKILSVYKDEGFAAAQVEPFTTADATNHVSITFFVTEGTQVLVQDVEIQGVTAFKLKKIKKLMKTRRKKVFKQDVLAKDLEEITKFYKNRGYQNIKITEPTQTFNAEKTRITLSLTLQEGPLFHFGASRFDGNAIFPSEKLLPAIAYKVGDIFNQEKMDATVSRLQDIYGAQGYIRVQVKPEFTQDAEKGIVDTLFKMTEGEVVYVDHIGIEGNTHTKDFVIRREIRLREGEPFSSVLARKSVERLYNLGFLDNVDVDVQQPNSPNKADVIFTVTEGKPGILSAGAGYSSVDGLIGTLQVQHINFLGRGQRVNLQWQFGARTNSFDLGWTEPWFMGKPMTFGLNVFNVTRTLQLSTIRDAYKTHDIGGSITVGPRFSEIYNLLFTYSYALRRRFDVYSDPTNPLLTADIRSQVLGPEAATDASISDVMKKSSNLTQQLVRDTRDNQFDPTRGQRTSLAMTEGGLFPKGSIKFYKPSVDHSLHIPTFWKFVLSLHGNWAMVKPYGDDGRDDIVDELFHIGGSDTVRGYELGRVGALDGGEIANVYNVEYKFPIAPDERGKTLLQGVFFYDIGGSWHRLSDVSYQTGSSQFGLKQGYGLGIRFKTPVFPLRLDWGHALNARPGEAQSQFYFTVGSLF